MSVPQTVKQDTAASTTASSTSVEPMAKHLRRIAAAAAWSVAPIVAGLLLFGLTRAALSVLGGAFVSFGVFAGLRVMVYKGLGLMAPTPGARPDPPGPHLMAQFAAGALLKFIAAGGVVYAMFKLGAAPVTLMIGFAVAQIAIAITVSRSLKNPVAQR